MSAHLSPIYNGWQGFGNGGLPLNGGLLYTYAAGTTTPVSSYTTSSGAVANTNPIVLDSTGRPPQEIWLFEGLAYKFVLTDSLSNPIATYDNIVGIGDFVAGAPQVNFAGTTQFAAGALFTGGNLVFSGSAQRISGDFSNATIANRLIFQTSTVNGGTDLVAIPNGISPSSSFNVFNGTDTANSAFGHIAIGNAEFSIQSSRTGAGVTLPLTFYCGNSGTPEAMRINTSQQLLVGTTSAAITGAVMRVGGIQQVDNSCGLAVNRGGTPQNGIASNTFTKVQLTTKRLDQNSNFDNVTNYRWTPPAGTYLILGNAQFTALTASGRTATIIYKNGAALFSNNVSGTVGNASGSLIGGVDTANGTDYYELFGWHLTGGTEAFSGLTQDTFLTGLRIG